MYKIGQATVYYSSEPTILFSVACSWKCTELGYITKVKLEQILSDLQLFKVLEGNPGCA